MTYEVRFKDGTALRVEVGWAEGGNPEYVAKLKAADKAWEVFGRSKRVEDVASVTLIPAGRTD